MGCGAVAHHNELLTIRIASIHAPAALSARGIHLPNRKSGATSSEDSADGGPPVASRARPPEGMALTISYEQRAGGWSACWWSRDVVARRRLVWTADAELL